MTIDINKYYNLFLSKSFGAIEYNVHIIGITNIDTVDLNDDSFNIYETYFKPLNLGLTSYYNAISDNTKIYICNLITSTEPLVTDAGTKIFIPDSLINYDTSNEFVPVSLFNFNISNIYNRYIDNESRDEYINTLMPKIRSSLQTLIEFSINELDLKQVNEVIYMREDEISNIETKRKELYDKLSTANNLIEQKNVSKETAYDRSVYTLQERIKEYDKLIEEQKSLNNRLYILLYG